MKTITLYVADADYDKVIQALSVSGSENMDDVLNASESKAIDAIHRWVMSQVADFDRYQHFEGFVFTPPNIVNPEPWVQPTGAHDAYDAEAIVLHNGAVWGNTHGDGNVWEPGVFGWTQL